MKIMTSQAVATFSSTDFSEDGITIPNIVRVWSDENKLFVPIWNRYHLNKALRKEANLETRKSSLFVGVTSFLISNGLFLITGYSAFSVLVAVVAAMFSIWVLRVHSYPFKKRKKLVSKLHEANLAALNEWMDKRYGFHVDRQSTYSVRRVMNAANSGYVGNKLPFTASDGKVRLLIMNEQGNLFVSQDEYSTMTQAEVVCSQKQLQKDVPPQIVVADKEFTVLLSSLNNDMDLLKNYTLTTDQEYVLSRAVSESKACEKLLVNALTLDSDTDTTAIVDALRVVCSEVSTVKSAVLASLMAEAASLNSYRLAGNVDESKIKLSKKQ